MARGNTIKVLRTTRANLDSQKAASGLIAGEPYLITDEDRFAVATAVNAYVDFARLSEMSPNAATLTSGDTTPSVAALGGRNGILLLPATTNYTITNFDDGAQFQEIVIHHIGTHNVTIDRSNAYLEGASNKVLVPNGSIRLLKRNSYWFQTSPMVSPS